MELRNNLSAKKTAVRNCERMVLGLPYRPLNTMVAKIKQDAYEEDEDVIMSKGEEDEDVFVDEDSNHTIPQIVSQISSFVPTAPSSFVPTGKRSSNKLFLSESSGESESSKKRVKRPPQRKKPLPVIREEEPQVQKEEKIIDIYQP